MKGGQIIRGSNPGTHTANSTPPPAVPPTVTQKQIVGPSETSTNTKGGRKKAGGGKRKRLNNADLFNEHQVFKRAVSVVICYMNHYRVSARRCVDLYINDMYARHPFDYKSLLPAIGKDINALAIKTLHINKYNRPQQNALAVTWNED